MHKSIVWVQRNQNYIFINWWDYVRVKANKSKLMRNRRMIVQQNFRRTSSTLRIKRTSSYHLRPSRSWKMESNFFDDEVGMKLSISKKWSTRWQSTMNTSLYFFSWCKRKWSIYVWSPDWKWIVSKMYLEETSV